MQCVAAVKCFFADRRDRNCLVFDCDFFFDRSERNFRQIADVLCEGKIVCPFSLQQYVGAVVQKVFNGDVFARIFLFDNVSVFVDGVLNVDTVNDYVARFKSFAFAAARRKHACHRACYSRTDDERNNAALLFLHSDSLPPFFHIYHSINTL